MSSSWGNRSGPWFSPRWSQENCVLSARTRRCEYPLFQQRLSIKAAWGGREECFVGGRRLAVDDDTFIILNEGCIYASRVHSREPVATFSIFFRPRMAQDVLRAMRCSGQKLLDDPEGAGFDTPVEFSEHLRRHDRQITPVLHFIRHHVDGGLTDEAWYEEQLRFLLERMLVAHQQDLRTTQLIPAVRAATRKELFRRVGLGADFINTHFAAAIGLDDIAVASLLSPYHCLRMFKAVHGCTPNSYLTHKRVQAAERMLRSSSSQVDEVAANVGFQSRTTLFRQMMSARGLAPSTIRRIQRESNQRGAVAP
ncbi:MAG: AraC family transcriptional regulator [Gammaproteobacteria bacterium]